MTELPSYAVYKKEKEAYLAQAFEEYSDELFRHAYFRLSSREEALEVLQDTYLKAWQHLLSHDEPIQDARAFLYRILKNRVIDSYRKKKSLSLEALAGEEEDTPIDAFLPPDESNTLAAATERLDGAAALLKVEELPEAYAEVILLRYVDGLSIGEIAKRIEITENLVSVRLYRALGALRTLLTSHD